MKKYLYLILSLTFILLLCGCKDEPQAPSPEANTSDFAKYRLDLDGNESLFKNVKESYDAGETVDISYDLIATDTDYIFTMDGESFSPNYDDSRGYVFKFTMPDHDVKITVSSRNSMINIPDIDQPDYDESATTNNNDYFVEHKGKIYFRMPTEYGMYEARVFGSFLDCDSGESAIYEYNPETGELTVLNTDYYSSGPISFLGDYLIYQGYHYSGDLEISNIKILPIVEDNLKFSINPDNQYCQFADKNGKYYLSIRYSRSSKDNSATALIYNNTVGYDKNIIIPDYSTGLGINDGILFYISYEEDSDGSSKEHLKQLNIETEEIIDLGILPDSEFTGNLSEVLQVEFTNDKVYLGYGFFEGSGHFYAHGYSIEATIGVENSINSNPFPASEDDSTPINTFAISNGTLILSEGIPKTAGTQDNSIGYYNETGDFIPVKSGYGWISDDDGEHVTYTEKCALIKDHIYLVRNEMVHISPEDIGWRMAYIRSKIEVIKINVNTGEETTLLTTLNDYPPISYSDIIGKWQMTEYEIEGDGPYYAENENIREFVTFNEDLTADYSFTNDYNKTLTQQCEVSFDGSSYIYSYDDINGPTSFYIYSLDENGNLGITMQFYYGDGTTASRSSIYKKVN